jgi:hypothetical protein
MDVAFREPPQRRRIERIVPWISVAVLAAGVGVAVWKFWPSLNHPANVSAAKTQHPVIVPDTPPKTVPLSREAKHVAGRFILTAVLRQNLAEAWNLSGPLIRQDLTRKEWMTGNIPVIPYPVDAIDYAPMKIDFSYPRESQIEVALLPKKGSKARPALFILGMIKDKHGHWLVNSWVPRISPAVPNGSMNNGAGE